MRWLLTIVLAVLGGFAGAAAWDFSGLGGPATRDYLYAHPEVLPEAINRYQAQQRLARLAPVRDQLETPFPGAVLGNPKGKLTLVEFSDYACTYCRQSVADVRKLIAANPDLRVVIREYPILRPESVDAARMGLAAAQPGKFAAFH
jgi:protein-disulfide isomerase